MSIQTMIHDRPMVERADRDLNQDAIEYHAEFGESGEFTGDEFAKFFACDPLQTKFEPDGNEIDDYAPFDPEPIAGWPGDGSGTDDLADYNACEADDYSNE